MAGSLPKLVPIRPADSGTWPETLSDPSKSLLEYWVSQCGDRDFADRAAIEPSEISRILPNIFIVEIVAGKETDYRFKLVGTHIVDMEGECTGQLLSELFADRDEHANIWKHYDACCLGEIYVRNGNLGWLQKKYIDCEVVLLPLYGSGGEVEYLIGAAHGTPSPR